jgi:hypothetical protein
MIRDRDCDRICIYAAFMREFYHSQSFPSPAPPCMQYTEEATRLTLPDLVQPELQVHTK